MKAIKTKDEHRAALARIEQLWDAIPNTPEGNELEALITQVQGFEDEHYPIDPPNAAVGNHAGVKEALSAHLKTIESNMRGLTTFSSLEAMRFLNMPCHNADEAKKMIVEQANLHTLFAFTFESDEEICIPAFQFDLENNCVLPGIPALAKCLSPISDWGTANWLLSFDEDLKMTPMDAVLCPEKVQALIDLAGLYLNSSTLRHLSNDE